MASYEETRQKYRPSRVAVLLIAESPPPASDPKSSRNFYKTDQFYKDDRLFVNTIKAVFKDAAGLTHDQLEQDKTQWLKRFKKDGYYMIEALEESQVHEVTKKQRQQFIKDSLPRLIERIRQLAGKNTKVILIKSNVYDIAAEPLRQAGFNVLNTELVDYPGRYNQAAFREKLGKLVTT